MKRKDVFQSKYLAQADITGKTLATIATVQQEKVGQGADQETKAIAHFAEQDLKPMVLNNVNWTALEDAYGEESDFWNGKRVEIYVDPSVMYAGKRVGGLRLRVPSTNGSPAAPATNGVVWDWMQALAECNKVALSKDQLVAHLKSLGKPGYNAARDTAAVQEFIRTAAHQGNADQPFDEAGTEESNIPF